MPSVLANKYDLLSNNAYAAKEKSFAETEVGDVLQPDFHPQVKIKRWDNKVNLSVRLVHEGTAGQVREEDGRIKWVGSKMEAHFYDTGSLGEDGGFEFEVICFKKPKDGRVQMTLQTKGLEFFYQPELTPEEIATGCVRPENVVGSYAVYHATRAGDYSRMGGQNYQAGKFCHIYRPRLVDAAGNWVWGELYIDVVLGLLTVAAPADFWDQAVYPVSHAAGLEFGYASAGASYTNFQAGYIRGSAATPGSSGSVSKLTAYCDSQGGTGNAKGLLVLSSALTIVSNGVTGGENLSATAGWYDFTFSMPPEVEADISYELMFIADGWRPRLYYDSLASGGMGDNTNDYSSPTDLTDATNINSIFSIYATYSAGGSSPQTVSPLGNIASAEAFGAAAVLPGGVALGNVGGIASALVFGNPVVAPGPVAVSNAGNIGSAEALGNPQVTSLHIIGPAGGIASAAALGNPGIIPGPVSLGSAGNIPGAEAWGLPVLSLGALSITGAGNIAGQETLGSLTIITGPVAILGAGHIPSGEAWGLPGVGYWQPVNIPEKLILTPAIRRLWVQPARRRLAATPQITRLQVTPDA